LLFFLQSPASSVRPFACGAGLVGAGRPSSCVPKRPPFAIGTLGEAHVSPNGPTACCDSSAQTVSGWCSIPPPTAHHRVAISTRFSFVDRFFSRLPGADGIRRSAAELSVLPLATITAGIWWGGSAGPDGACALLVDPVYFFFVILLLVFVGRARQPNTDSAFLSPLIFVFCSRVFFPRTAVWRLAFGRVEGSCARPRGAAELDAPGRVSQACR